MRQRLGEKKLARWRRRTGLDIVSAMVRGNTSHRTDLFTADGKLYCAWPDGTIEEQPRVKVY